MVEESDSLTQDGKGRVSLVVEEIEVVDCYLAGQYLQKVYVIICDLVIHVAKFSHRQTTYHTMR